ncbi:PREDICTED: interleukin-37 [Chrysochloris asiatica]|uniref:Interleukin-1 n=1 Tax=Chrysochloris asiatica TaxID=185453 RepID=A0A9B0U3U9_CHRAS|nr:PREDICTED: interleukin-37 [Chrysochloris asiatica]
MSFLENSDVKMDSQEWEKDEPQGCSEGPNTKVRHPELFCISDLDQKVLVVDCGVLKAVPKKSYVKPEVFSVFPSHLRSASEVKGSPVLLAVDNGELYLCCEKGKGQSQPSLQLKKKKINGLDAQKNPKLKPFIFYKAEVGSRYTLESAAYHNWFLCTSSKAYEPVGMTDNLGKHKHTEFSFVKF